MRKFEVGDLVAVVNEAHDLKCRDKSYAGECGVVQKTEADDDSVLVNISEGNSWLFGAEELAPTDDPINHPPHYSGYNGIECIDAMRATLTPDEFRGYCKGAAFKYIWRERQKGGNESLAKAVWYLNEAQK